MTNLAPLMDRNRTFVDGGFAHHAPRLPFLPFTGLFVVTCIDPRTDPADFLGLTFGEAIVTRTVGGRVTDAVLRDLAYISYLVETKAPEGPFFEIAIIHHTDCGSRLLEDPELRRDFAHRTGYDEGPLAELPATVPADTVRADVAKVRAAPNIHRQIAVTGHVLHTATGRLETVVEDPRLG